MNCEDSLQANTHEVRNSREAAASKRYSGRWDACTRSSRAAGTLSGWASHTRRALAGESRRLLLANTIFSEDAACWHSVAHDEDRAARTLERLQECDDLVGRRLDVQQRRERASPGCARSCARWLQSADPGCAAAGRIAWPPGIHVVATASDTGLGPGGRCGRAWLSPQAQIGDHGGPKQEIPPRLAAQMARI